MATRNLEYVGTDSAGAEFAKPAQDERRASGGEKQAPEGATPAIPINETTQKVFSLIAGACQEVNDALHEIGACDCARDGGGRGDGLAHMDVQGHG